jgi:hypothetical protein
MTLSDKLLYPLVKVATAAFKSISVDWYKRNGYPQLARLLGGVGPTHTGRSVSEDTAQNCMIASRRTAARRPGNTRCIQFFATRPMIA